MPESWEWCRLGNIITVLGDGIHGTPKYDENGDYFFINGNNLEDGKIIIRASTKTVHISEYERYQKPLTKRTVLVSINGTLGNIAFFNSEQIILGKSACYFNVCENIDLSYIKNIIDSKYFHAYAHDQATGSTIKNLSLLAMREILVPLPPYKEQIKISQETSKLEFIVENIEDNKEQLSIFIKAAKYRVLDLAIRGKLVPQDPNDEPASALLKRIKAERLESKKKASKTSDNSHYENLPFEIPKNWVWLSGYECFKPMTSVKPIEKSFCYIDIDAIDNIQNIVKSPKVILTSEAPSRATREVNDGDTIFSMVRPYLRNIAYIDKTLSSCIASTGFFVCKPMIALHPRYLYYMMLSDFVVNGLNQFMKGDNSPSINNDNILSWFYPIPPYNEQVRIVGTVQNLHTLLDDASLLVQ
ncbi:restriction endonuclease subunit S [Bacteroides sp. 214]|nr:restriction endonuclease subunit S [Bacteroides sp. 214]